MTTQAKKQPLGGIHGNLTCTCGELRYPQQRRCPDCWEDVLHGRTLPSYKLHVSRVEIAGELLCETSHENEKYSYRIIFNETGTSPNKSATDAFADLRKAIKYHRRNSRQFDLNYEFSGNVLTIRHDCLLFFLDWMEFTAPFETLRKEAMKRYKQNKAYQRRFTKEWDRKYPPVFDGMCEVIDALQLFHLLPNATQSDIKRQYYLLAKQHHPDIGGDAEQMKRINQAYEVLVSLN